jgi:signal transduction histidine kinase
MKSILSLRPTAFLPRSIAFRLIVAVLSVELLSSVVVVFLSFGYERHTHFHAFDTLLIGHADTILGAVQDAKDPQGNVMLVQADLHLPPDNIYEVYGANGHLLGRSPNWQGVPPEVEAPHWGPFLTLNINGREFRVFRIHGSRIINPTAPGGGEKRPVTILYGAPIEYVWRSIFGTVEFYAAGSALLLLVTGPLIAWLLHRGLLPLRQLASMAAGVSVNAWHFSPPESARRTPELAPLTLAIESVLQRLERSFLQQQIFVSDAAHELKTAVAVVKSSLQLLCMKRRSAAEYQAGLQRCLADSMRLEEIVAKMLTLARAEGGAADALAPPSTDLAESLHRTIDDLETVAAQRGVIVRIASPPVGALLVPVTTDDCALLLSNLLLNALQHSPPESTVEVRVSQEPATVEVQIQDHGEGIDPAALPQVFDRFYRGDPSRTRSTGGTGLGLAIAKAIVLRAGGFISIDSELGQGTTAAVSLPLVQESAAS